MATRTAIAGRDIKNETITAAINSTTLVSQQAQITATDNLTINADRDINLVGTKVSGLDINLTAGHNLDIGSVTHKDNQGLKNITTQLTSDITASGNLTLVAKNDLKLSGVAVDVGKDATLDARHNLELTTVQNDSIVNGTRVLIGATDIRTNTTNIGTTIKGKGNVALTSGNDTLLTGINIDTDKDVTVTAGHNLDIRSAVDKSYRRSEDDSSNHMASITTNLTSDIKAGKDIVITGKKDVNFQGVQLSASNDLTVTADGNLIATAVKDEEIYDNRIGSLSGSYTRKMTDDETVVGTNFNAQHKISITATGEKDNKFIGNIILEGSHVNSEKGEVGITAANDITIKNTTEYHETLTESKKIDSGFFSTKVTEKRDRSILNQVSGSGIYGDKVAIKADNDLVVKGSNVAGKNDVSLEAVGGNVSIISAKETGKDEHYSYTKTSGIFSGGGLGFTIGSKSEKTTATDQTLGEIGSTIGSIDGKVSITAGDKVNSAGTTFISDKDLDIKGKEVTIENTINTYDSQYKYEFKQSGLSVSLGGKIIDTATSLTNKIKRSGEVQNKLLKGLYMHKAFNDYQQLHKDFNDYEQFQKAYDKALNKVKGVENINPKDAKAVQEAGNKLNQEIDKLLSIDISIGSRKTTYEQNTHVETVNSSNISAGGNVNITATKGDVNLKGTNINGKDVTLDAKQNLNIKAAQNKQQTDSKTSSSSWSIGGSFGAGTGSFLGIIGGVNSSNGKEKGNSVTNTESVINASGTLKLKSGNDTNINGSQVKGEKADANIGGNLNLASLQDSNGYKANNNSSGFDFSTSIGSFNKGKTNSIYDSVIDQAGIFAGKGGFDIYVGKNTDLKGAVIASEATLDKNKLSTETLTYSDIQNKAEYDSSSIGVNVNTSKDAKLNEKGITPNIGVPASGDASSTTKSAVAIGKIDIRSNPNQDISNLSRNTDQAVNTLGKIFDKKTVQEKQELAKVFGEEAFKAVGDLAGKQWEKAAKANDKEGMKLWDDGGAYKIILHSMVGGIMDNLGGGNFVSGAAGAGVNEAIQGELSKIKDPALHQWASTIVGAAVSKIIGRDSQTGAATAVSGTKYNWQNGHDKNYSPTVQAMLLKLTALYYAAEGDPDEQARVAAKSNEIRQLLDEGYFVAALDKFSSWSSSAAATNSIFGSSSRAERDAILAEVQQYDPDVDAGDNSTQDALFFVAGFAIPMTKASLIFKSGRAGEEYLLNKVGGVAQKYFWTSQGGRFIDVLANGVAYESKVGYVPLTSFVKRQVLKDAELIARGEIEAAEWNFYRSGITGKIGPSQPLLDFLQQHGIKYVIHD